MQLFVNTTTQHEMFDEADVHEMKDDLPLAVVEADADFNVKKIFPLLQTPLLNKWIGNALPAAFSLFEKLNALIESHAHHVYVTAGGVSCRLGDVWEEMKDAKYNRHRLDCYPLPEVWRGFYRTEIGDYPALLQLLFALATNWGEGTSYKVYEFMNKEFLPEIRRFYGFDLHGLKKALAKLPYMHTVQDILHLLGEENRDEAYACSVAENILASFVPLLDKANARKEFVHETYRKKELRTVFVHQHSCIAYWMSGAFGRKDSAKAFGAYFMLRYQFYRKSDYLTTHPPVALGKAPLSIFDFAKACSLGLVSEAELGRELQNRVNAEESLHLASAFLFHRLKPWQRNRLKAYGETDFAPLKKLVRQLSEHILSRELSRGEEPTEVSHLAMKLEGVEGARVLTDILKAFGQEPFGRTDFYYTATYTRKEVLTRLLRICYPAQTDTAQGLSDLAQGANISHERLIEAAVYAPQWLPLVEECSGWKGLQSAACFFHAHMNERCDTETAALIARFSPMRREDLCLGAFDVHWYRQAHREMGAKRFALVLDAAAGMASGSDYGRLLRFLDAANGKPAAPEVRRQVEENRNRDLLMRYGVIPLNRRSEGDLTERYAYFLRYLGESKRFGSQRQENEKKAVELGLLNLACNAGLGDVSRLIWQMETRSFKQIKPLFAFHSIHGVRVCLRVDAAGKPGVHFFKAGKELIHIPNKLRKDPYVVQLREMRKRLGMLFSGSQNMLERMLDERTPFGISELQAFRKNPLVWPWLKTLVFITPQGNQGLYTEGGLQTPDGKLLAQDPSGEVYLAHPVDFHEAQTLDLWQEFLRSRGMEQPLEQVFRKRYAVGEGEVSAAGSCPGYTGRRILTERMAGVLTGRRWMPVDPERWQKVYFREDVAVHIETQSEALSLTDLGASILRRIVFFERRGMRPLAISEVPGRIFSEVLRDVEALM
ncbi:MAG: DUF4132 domain-containing protein [Tannerellaceae bacterium]|jgi:hypothetical protein|nr:DUF4132 domain-containing protein [Tannerellaceae bacterium]